MEHSMHQGEETHTHDQQKRSTRILSGTQAIRLIEQITGVRISKSTLWRWHLAGRITGTKIGRRFFTTEESVEAMLRNDALLAQPDHGSPGAQARDRLLLRGNPRRANTTPESIDRTSTCQAHKSRRRP